MKYKSVRIMKHKMQVYNDEEKCHHSSYEKFNYVG